MKSHRRDGSTTSHSARRGLAMAVGLLFTCCAARAAEPAPDVGDLPGLTTVGNAAWNELAVRKVLPTFAFGGQASDAQIARWADMPPRAAIRQMLTFDEHNLRLSPPDRTLSREHMETRPQSLRALSTLWSSTDRGNYVPSARRAGYSRADWMGGVETWTTAARVRGGNPFRHRVGFWETNFHLATSHNKTSTWQIIRAYDDTLAALAANRPYEDVIATASLTGAVTTQYGTQYNRYYDQCYCNEDFAREFHQLGFGILGSAEPEYHERVSIKNTAAALSGIYLTSNETPNEWEAEKVNCGLDGHVPTAVEVQHTLLDGGNACAKIRQLARVSIKHPESVSNLPVMIVQGIADDEISPAEAAALRRAWRGMPQKNLLRFLRAYAVSTLFHSRDRVKHITSIERFITISNLIADSNREHYADVYESWRLYWDEEMLPFRPLHEVFGHQTGPEAAGSAQIFRKHYAASTEGVWRYVEHDAYPKDWRRMLPAKGRLTVRQTAEWLWEHFIVDGQRNFGPLERAHVYALLSAGRDLAPVYQPRSPDTPVTRAQLDSAAGKRWLAATGKRKVGLESAVEAVRRDANQRIGAAVAFIIATPFMLAQEGR